MTKRLLTSYDLLTRHLKNT